jgi:GTP-binding protein HflX
MHVIDVASPDLERRMAAVRKVLADIGLEQAPELLVFNQADRMPPGEAQAIASRLGGVAVSALNRTGLPELLSQAERLLWTGDPAPRLRRKTDDLAATGG